MVDFLSRASMPKGHIVPSIPLTQTEEVLYGGAGEAIAIVNPKNEITDLVYLWNFNDKTRGGLIKGIKDNNKGTTLWHGMLSCYEFCNPVQVGEELC
jgi:hypothetical protein|tara:strand:- start:157 stop:447 length:291 start_codon:yes stop_codon:yes gene_type:complete